LFADFDCAIDIRDGASVHIGGVLAGDADAYDFKWFGFFGDDGFDKLRPDVEGKQEFWFFFCFFYKSHAESLAHFLWFINVYA